MKKRWWNPHDSDLTPEYTMEDGHDYPHRRLTQREMRIVDTVQKDFRALVGYPCEAYFEIIDNAKDRLVSEDLTAAERAEVGSVLSQARDNLDEHHLDMDGIRTILGFQAGQIDGLRLGFRLSALISLGEMPDEGLPGIPRESLAQFTGLAMVDDDAAGKLIAALLSAGGEQA